MRFPKRFLARVARDVFFALVLLEAGLRAWAFTQDLRARSRTFAPGDLVVVLGDAHALGYPALVTAELGKHGLALLNAGRKDLNSAEALAELPALLETQKPAAVVLLVGEANFWNRRFLGRYLADRPGVLDFFAELRIARLLRRGALSDPPADGGALGPDDFVNWARHDLVRLVRLARERGVAVLLQTYPPERFTGRARAVDAAIRSVASDLHVPLSDTQSELAKRWNGRALQEFYVPPPGELLNQEGDRLVADLLLADLARAGLLLP